MASREALIKQVLEESPEPTVALNPLTGFHTDDLKAIVRRTALQGARQPLIFGKHFTSHARKLVGILGANSEYNPEPRDSRFNDEAWR